LFEAIFIKSLKSISVFYSGDLVLEFKKILYVAIAYRAIKRLGNLMSETQYQPIISKSIKQNTIRSLES
jgi:hypothetical protein